MTKAWDAAAVRKWLESRVAAARSDQVSAQRGGRDREDDCDKAAAEEMVCAFLKAKVSLESQPGMIEELRIFLARDDYLWSGVYNDTRFDRHVRAYAKKLVRMAKTNDGFERTGHYQR